MQVKIKITDFDAKKSLKMRGLEKGGRVQKFIDSEVIRLCDPLVPVRSHVLRESATKSTKIGSGLVVYDTPYARRQYYENTGRWQQGQRGKLWFERMKARHRENILRGAKKIASGKV